MKKTTLKDIAREAGVSVATVSYILNNVQNQTISEETRSMVREIAERLQYVPNLTAKSLVKGETKLIGILLNKQADEKVWRSIPQERFVMELERLLSAEGYHVILASLDADSPKLDVVMERKLDGVFLIDVREEAFYSISTRFKMGVPLVVIDSLIEDDLFHKVLPDYGAVLNQAISSLTGSFALITEQFNNAGINRLIDQKLQLPEEVCLRLAEERQLPLFLEEQQRHGRHILIVNEIIGLMTAKYVNPASLTVVCTGDLASLLPSHTQTYAFRSKAAAAFDTMMKHLRGEPFQSDSKFVWVLPL